MSLEIFTIGVFGLTENEFFDKLTSNKIDLFIDIRRRRAVRGSKYAFVNSTKLQNKLAELGIQYEHILELAPTNEIRTLQKEDDIKKGIQKVERQQLGDIFIQEYKHHVLDKFDFNSFYTRLGTLGVKNVVLFCVEKFPRACHRSLVTDRLQQQFHNPIHHL